MSDQLADASYAYDEALMGYEDALASRDPDRRRAAETALAEAARILSRLQSERVAARQGKPAKPAAFATLLGDPMQQLDPDGLVMQSIRDYQNATTNTPSADGGAR